MLPGTGWPFAEAGYSKKRKVKSPVPGDRAVAERAGRKYRLTVVNTWTDSRLDDLASVVRPLPGEVAQLSVKVDGIARDTELIRADLSALQRQLAQIGRAIAGTLAVGLIAILIALV